MNNKRSMKNKSYFGTMASEYDREEEEIQPNILDNRETRLAFTTSICRASCW